MNEKEQLKKRVQATRIDPEVDALQRELVSHFKSSVSQAVCRAVLRELTKNHPLVTLGQVLGESRLKHIAQARVAIYRLVHKATGWSYPALGKLFVRDHTTIMASVREPAAKKKKEEK